MANPQSLIPRPTTARMQTLEAVRSATGGGFDADAWHVIEERDNQLIADEVLNGAGSTKFVYQFDLGSTAVVGISVIGARHLAAAYGGLKHRMVASVQKTGALFTFSSYPQPGTPMVVECRVIPDLEGEDDFFSAICEITDVKTGNSIQVEKKENRFETKKNGDTYERPHYALIAQSKAYRNGILAVIPQDTQMRWKLEMLKLSKTELITSSVIDEKRSGVLKFAASKGITVDRKAVEQLTIEQISGLSEAARTGRNEFMASAQSLRVLFGADVVGLPAPPASMAPPPNKPAAPQTQTVLTKAAPSPPPSAPPFEAYLVDDTGEVISDLITDPGVFGELITTAIGKAGNMTTLLDNNREAVEAAQGFPNAAGLLASLQAAIAAEAADGELQIPLAAGARGPDITGWIKSASLVLPALDAERMQDWIGANQPTWRSFPMGRRLEVERMVVARCTALGLKWSPPAPASQGLPLEDAKPEHMAKPDRWVDDQLDNLTRANTTEDLVSLANRLRQRMDDLKEPFAKEWQRLSDAFSRKAEMLKAEGL